MLKKSQRKTDPLSNKLHVTTKQKKSKWDKKIMKLTNEENK